LSVEDAAKLTALVGGSLATQQWLVNQGILPGSIVNGRAYIINMEWDPTFDPHIINNNDDTMAEGGDIEMDVFDRGEREEDIQEDDFDTSRILEDIDTGLYTEEVDIDEYDNMLGTRLVPANKKLTQLNLELKKRKSKRFLRSY
jgi:hypothetical protein